jgi:hypothetical protein
LNFASKFWWGFLLFVPFSPASADSNSIPDPYAFILASKIVHLADTEFYILKWQDQLRQVSHSKIDPSYSVRRVRERSTKPREGFRSPAQRGCALENNPPSTFTSGRARREYINCLQFYIDKLTVRLARIEANDLSEILDPFSPPLAVGDIGRMYGEGAEYQYLVILGIVDSNNCRALFHLGEDSDIPVWLEGLPTANLVDGSQITPPPFMRITGARDYLTPYHDKKTVFILEKFVVP